MLKSKAMATVRGRLEETGGRSTGFDYLRVLLAVAVVLWHTVALSYGGDAAIWVMSQHPYRAIIAIILPAFFALSGFLVTGSLDRNSSLLRFVALRGLRIVPALALEVVLSAVILGPILTTLTLSQYFAHPDVHDYFQNIIGRIHYFLPGVFSGNPYPNVVNGQLWTIPHELDCYLALAMAAALGLVRRRWLFLVLIVAVQALLVADVIRDSAAIPAVDADAVSGRVLVMAFLAGVTLHRFGDVIPMRGWLCVAAALASVTLLSLPLGDEFVAFPVAYATVWLGLQSPKANFIVKFGDLSYGIYLYGFAVQQLVASLGTWTHHWYINAALSLPIVCGIAWLSWTFVEKPALGLRRHLTIFDSTDMLVTKLRARLKEGLKSTPAVATMVRQPLVARVLRTR